MSKTVALYMVKDPVSVSSNIPLAEIMQTMQETQLSHLLVEDDKQQLVGIISKNDILRYVKTLMNRTTGPTYSNFVNQSITAEEIMTSEYVSVQSTDSVDFAIELLLQKEFHCLPVVKNGKSVGIVTFYDLLKGYYQEYG